MRFSKVAVKKYRIYRLFLAAGAGLFAFTISMGGRYSQELDTVHSAQHKAALSAVKQIDHLLSSANDISTTHNELVNSTCPQAQPRLLNMSVQLQTVRAILLVKEGLIFCSSLFGHRDYSLGTMFPPFAKPGHNLMLKAALLVKRGSPTLIYWVPTRTDPSSGMIHVFHIAMLSNFILEPQKPYVDYMALNVDGNTLIYGHNNILRTAEITDKPSVSQASSHYAYSVGVFSDPDWKLALRSLPQHIPLSLLVFLLAGIIVFIVSANWMNLAYHISSAIQRKQFQLFCQPIIQTQSGECDGVEILLRWHDERQGWISPDIFIPLAEQHGLVQSLTRHLLYTLEQNQLLFPQTPDFYISINIAAEHFSQGQITKDLKSLWYQSNPQPKLMLELTERTELQQADYEQLHELRALGASLALDDFGTGHSSLSYLQNLHPDVLKIDKTFCATIGTDAINAKVLDSIVALGKELKLKMIVEGVETQLQADYLRKLGVCAMQGYFFARPMPIAEFPQWLMRHQARHKDTVQ